VETAVANAAKMGAERGSCCRISTAARRLGGRRRGGEWIGRGRRRSGCRGGRGGFLVEGGEPAA
jgi:hypothetical protein